MAMFVLVVDTSLMNVSISSVVEDLDTTVSGVQSAIALEALVSAAFILIGSKIGDLFGRKRAYVLGLLGYAVGALSMALAQNVTTIVHLLGDPRRARRLAAAAGDAVADPRQLRRRRQQRQVYALVGAAAAIAAAVGPLIGGFITTYLSWRVAFLLEAVVIAVVLSGIGLVRDVPYTGPRTIDVVGAVLSVGRHGRDRARHPRVAGGRRGGRRPDRWSAPSRWPGWRGGWCAASAAAKSPLIDPDLFASKPFRLGISQQMMQQIALGGTMIALPIFLQMVLEYNAMEAGLSLAPLSLSMFAVALIAGQARPATAARPNIIHRRLRPARRRPRRSCVPIVPRADSGWDLVIPLIIAGCGLGLLVSQLNNYTLSPITEERVSEAAGVNSAAGSFGLSFGLAFAGAIMLATLSFLFTDMAEGQRRARTRPAAAGRRCARGRRRGDEQHQARGAARRPARRRSRTRSSGSTPTPARGRCRSRCSCRSAAALIGLFNAFRMARLPDPVPSGAAEGMLFD